MRRKKRRKKKKALSSKSIICITTIAMLNIMGVSYGVWFEDGKMNAKISTGHIDPCFTRIQISENEDTGVYYDRKISQTGEIIEELGNQYTIRDDLEGDISRGGANATIYGKAISSSDHVITIRVENNGTIPIKLRDVKNGKCSRRIEIEPRDDVTIEIEDVFIEPDSRNNDVILIFEQSI